jgi:Protein of unknown function (DUF3000)
MRSAGQHPHPADDDVFRAAAADLYAGREAQRPIRPQITFDDVAAPKTLAPYAAAIAATVRSQGLSPDEDADVGWGRLVLLYDPDGQQGWAGPFRLIAYLRAEVEPELAADPLLGTVSWTWLTEALDAGAAGYAAPSGTVTRVITEGFGGKQDEPPSTGLEIRASWSPVGEAEEPPPLAGHVTAWCDALCTAAGLPPAPAGVRVMPQRRRSP